MRTPKEKLLKRLAEQEARLKALEATPQAVATKHLVVLCGRAGERGETRPPGCYPRPGSGAPLVVFEGESPPEHLLRRVAAPGALVLILGPDHVDPPADLRD